MQIPQHTSIRQKLTRIVLLASGVAVLVACTVFAIYDITTFRRSMANDLTTVAEIVGANTTAALTFGDQQSAHETLNSLKVKPHVVEACIFGIDGQVFASYSRQNLHPDFAGVEALPEGVSIRGGHMLVIHLIRLNGDRVGTIYLKSDLNELYARAARFAGIILAVLLASFLASYLLASRLQRVISEPILELARTAFNVSTAKDYTVRATKRSDDEIGFLFDRFNEMLVHIQQRDSELVWARDELEVRVDERTRELQAEIVERKLAEDKLRTSFRELEELKSAMDQHSIVARTDSRGIITFVNEKFCSISKYSPEELIGQDHRIVNAHFHSKEFMKSLWQTIKSGRVWKGEIKNRAKDGSEYWVDTTIVPFCDADGKPRQFIAIRMDITALKKIETELRHEKEVAEAATVAKSEFLANMSHEIRTPMNGIIGMTGLALDTQLTTEQREYLGMVKTSADSLLTLINDILDFSKIEAGKLDLDPIDFPLRQSLGETLKALGLRAHQKGLELAWRVGPGVPDFLIGDLSRLRQVLVNLVGNALKFTEHGEVVVGVELAHEISDGAHLHFTVRDTGIGIPPEKQKLVFEAFTQADGSTTRRYGGTGLGLAITTQIVHLMGGQIWLESELGRGSTFHFTVRLGVAKYQPESYKTSDQGILRNCRALVVDDNETNRKILDEMLSRWGLRVELADGADAALEILERSQRDSRHFSLIVTDMQMPHVDGFGLIKAVRKNRLFDGIPIVVLSSSALPGEKARGHELGVSAYLMKPTQPSELLDAILSAVSKSPEKEIPAPQATPSTQEVRPGMKILLAEDNAVNRALARKLLEKQGHLVVLAENGREALKALDRESVDLVLMDVQMPEMDGLEATRAIREREKATGAHLPIISLTAHAMKGDRERCLASGADDYLTKPIHPPDLLAALDRIQSLKTVKAASSAVAPPVLSADSFDLAAALQRVEGDRELLEEIAHIFAEDCPKILAEIRGAFESSDARLLERLAHTLKGSASNLGALSLPRSAAELEQMARAGDFRGATAQFKIVEKDARALLVELEGIAGKVAH